MRIPRVDKSWAITCLLLVCITALWTWAAGTVLAIGMFVAADSRCNGDPPRVNMDGGWLVIATVCAWAAPFVAVAIRRTSLVSVTIAVLAVGLGAAIIVHMFRVPGTFCF